MEPFTKELKKFVLTVAPTGLKLQQEIFRNSAGLYNLLKQIHIAEGNEFQEFFYVLFLNRANQLTGYWVASMGGMTGTVADPRLIIKAAALANCTSIVLSHNHPSGNLQPSRADEDLTEKIKQAASYFEINVLDHIIVHEEKGYFSFADEGIL